MMRQQYVDFIEAFERISPYELDHFCSILFEHYSKHLSTVENRKMELSDLKDFLISSMHAAQINIAQLKVEEAKLALDHVQSRHMMKQPI